MNEGLLIDSKQVLQLFDELDMSHSDMRKAVNSGLRRAGNIITRQAKNNLKSVQYDGKNLANVGLLQAGVNILVWKKQRGATIGLIDNRKAKIKYKGGEYKNPAYLLRWINAGTKHRKTGKGYNRGMLSAKSFFSDAVSQTSSQAEQTFMEAVNKAIVRISNKNRT